MDSKQNFGRTIHVRHGAEGNSNRTDPRSFDKRPGVKGHDAVLKALQDGGRQATLVTLAGESFGGKIVGRDKFTITLLVDSVRLVFYKHGLERFYGEEAPTHTGV